MGLEKIKVVLLGQQGSGKSTMLNTYIIGDMVSLLEPTTTTSFMCKTLKIKDKFARLEIWDTVGQERFNSFTKIYLRGVRAVILTYDTSEEESLYKLQY